MDGKSELISNITMRMTASMSTEELQKLQMVLYMEMNKYDVTLKSTELVEYKGEENEVLLKRFLVAKKIKGCTDRTLFYYGTEIKKILEKIGKSVCDITTDDIRYYLVNRKIRDEIRDTTVDNELRCLKTFFNYLNQEEIIFKNPVARIEKIKCEKIKKEALTEMEVAKVKEACGTQREKAIIEILLSTGCRISELVQIKLEEIEDNTILIHGKGKKDRFCYLNVTAMLAMQNYLGERKDNSPYLFPGAIDNALKSGKFVGAKHDWYKHADLVSETNPVRRDTVAAMVREIGKRVNVKLHPHKCRRTCATFALRCGMPIEQVSKMLGHESIDTTQIYLDLTEDELKQAHAKYVR